MVSRTNYSIVQYTVFCEIDLSLSRNTTQAAVINIFKIRILLNTYAFFLKMFIIAVCVVFLLKLRWPKSKSLYDLSLLSN